MIGLWGMSDVIGPVAVIPEDPQFQLAGMSDVAPVTQQLVDDEVRHLISQAHEQVTELMSTNRDRLDALADALLTRETLEQDEAYAAAGIATPVHQEPPVNAGVHPSPPPPTPAAVTTAP